MDTNIVNDITDIYFGQIAISEAKKPNDGNLANNYPPYDEVTYGDVVAGRLGKDQMGGRKKRKKVHEAKKPNDGNLANNYSPYDEVTRGDVIAGAIGKDQMGGKKKKKEVKEGFSNWRQDLSEVMDTIEKEENDKEITENPNIKNKITINPSLGEAVEELGGTLLEMTEIEDFEEVFDELSESDIFFLTDDLIEEVVEEVFEECLQEGYNIFEIENVLLESLEVSSALLNEAKLTYGHDTDVKSDRLEKVKTAVKKVGKGILRGAGYVAGAAVRGAKAVGRELGAGYKRGRRGSGGSSDSDSSSDSSSSGGSSRVTQERGSSRPGLLGRIGSALKKGLRRILYKGAKAVEIGAGSVARRTADRPKVTQGKGVETQEKPNPRSKGLNSIREPKRPPSVTSGGKKIEVAGEPKKQEPEGTSENPRVDQPGPEKKPSKPQATTKTTKVNKPATTRRFGRSSSFTSTGEAAYQAAKQAQEKKPSTTKPERETKVTAAKPKREPNPKKPGKPSLDDLLRSEEFQLSEMSISKNQQKLFGLALSVKRGETPRSEASAEVLKIVDSMSEKKIRDFAKTSHEGLPKKVQTKEEAIREALRDRMLEKIEEQSF
jgi:hypothetical protein